MEYEVSRVLTCKLPPHQQDRPGSLSCSVFLIKEKKKLLFPTARYAPSPRCLPPSLSFFSLPVCVFPSKSLLAFLFMHQQAWACNPPCSWFPGRREKGAPTYLSCCPAPLMLSEKLRSLAPQNGGSQICPSSVEFTSVRNMNTEVKRKCE